MSYHIKYDVVVELPAEPTLEDAHAISQVLASSLKPLQMKVLGPEGQYYAQPKLLLIHYNIVQISDAIYADKKQLVPGIRKR